MSSNSGKNLLTVYIKHLENAATILEKLPNKFYRDETTNLLLNHQKKELMKLADEIDTVYSLLSDNE